MPGDSKATIRPTLSLGGGWTHVETESPTALEGGGKSRVDAFGPALSTGFTVSYPSGFFWDVSLSLFLGLGKFTKSDRRMDALLYSTSLAVRLGGGSESVGGYVIFPPIGVTGTAGGNFEPRSKFSWGGLGIYLGDRLLFIEGTVSPLAELVSSGGTEPRNNLQVDLRVWIDLRVLTLANPF